MLTKWADWQSVEKARKPREQKSPLIFYIRAIFAVAGFISALRPPGRMPRRSQSAQMTRGSGMTSLLKS